MKVYYLQNNKSMLNIGFSNQGSLSTYLPAGASNHLYQLYVLIQVIDNDGAVAIYTLPSPIVVATDLIVLNATMNAILSLTSSSQVYQDLVSGDVSRSTSVVVAFCLTFDQALADGLLSSQTVINNKIKNYFFASF